MDTFGIVLIVLAVLLLGWLPISSLLDGIAKIILAIKGTDVARNDSNKVKINVKTENNEEDEE